MELPDVYQIAELISKYIAGSITAREYADLEYWRDRSENNRKLLYKFSCVHFIGSKKIAECLCDHEGAYQRFVIRRRKQIRRGEIRRMITVAAAVMALFVGIVVAFSYHRETGVLPLAEVKVIPAGESRAVLTLNDGQEMFLDRSMADTLVVRDGAIVNASGNSVVYRAEAKPGYLKYNQLDIPRKGEFILVLSDGTRVQLNSESRIRYPVHFVGAERRVYLEGEAYFEVAKNEKVPFVVEVGKVTVQVSGTTFNVRAYTNETNIYTTLVEGGVRLSVEDKNLILCPGEQGIVNTRTATMNKSDVDVRFFIGWKDGRFLFDEQPLEEIMNTLARWYDVKICFSSAAVRQVTFSGNLKRYDNFDKILKMLEMAGTAQFRMDGDTIYVSEK